MSYMSYMMCYLFIKWIYAFDIIIIHTGFGWTYVIKYVGFILGSKKPLIVVVDKDFYLK